MWVVIDAGLKNACKEEQYRSDQSVFLLRLLRIRDWVPAETDSVSSGAGRLGRRDPVVAVCGFGRISFLAEKIVQSIPQTKTARYYVSIMFPDFFAVQLLHVLAESPV